MEAEPQDWFAVRCVFRLGEDWPADEAHEVLYEERITLWLAGSIDDAIALAEAEATQQAADVDAEYVGFARAYQLFDQPVHGAEVFSLLRSSALDTKEYLDRHFDSGKEREQKDA